MPTTVKVSILQKVACSSGLDRKEAAAFRELFRADRVEHTVVEHNAPQMLPKAEKELRDFCAFARSDRFKPTIKQLIGIEAGNTLELEMLSAEEKDPPDIILKIGPYRIGIEITDFPPDRTALAKAIVEVKGPAPMPAFYEGACSPEIIKRFMSTPVSGVIPHHSSHDLDVTALSDCARDAIGKKSSSEKSTLLLLAAPFASEWPTDEIVDTAVAAVNFKSIKAVVLILSNKSLVFWTKHV